MKRGHAWELELEQLHRIYRRDRRAVVLRGHPPVRILQDQGGRFVGCFDGSGPPDFVGVLANGRAVAFDAKSCAAKRFPLAQLVRHQASDLEAVHLAGGVAGVALRLGSDAYWLPWLELGPRYWEPTAASLVPEPWWRPFHLDGWLSVV